MIEKLIRPNIRGLKPYTSARDSFLEGLLLDANENPYGSVVSSGQLELNRYPDPAQREERKLLSAYLNIPHKNLFLGVGSDEIIDLLIRIFCEPRKHNAIINDPTYGMYKVACDINDVNTKTIMLNKNFQLDLPAISNSIEKDTRMIFLCSPNNPTGECLQKEDIIELAKSTEAIIVVDEAYIDFAETKTVIEQTLQLENLVVLRTFSKAWGLAGVRCGYCSANEMIIETLMKVKAPYNLNTLTRNVIKEAIKNSAKKNKFVENIIEQKKNIQEELSRIEKIKKVYNSDANFLLFEIENSKYVFNELCRRGVVIRDRSSQPRLEDCLRLSIGTHEENLLFLKTLKEII